MAGYTDSFAGIFLDRHRAASKRQLRLMALVFVIATLALAIYTHFKGA